MQHSGLEDFPQSLVVYPGSGHWPLQRPAISTEQSKGQMQSVEIPLYQTGKLPVAAFQIGAAQDQQTKSAEAVLECASRSHNLSLFVLILAENVKSFQSSVPISYRVHCQSIIYCSHRIFANMVSTTVRIDHFCTEIRTVTFDCTDSPVHCFCTFRLLILSRTNLESRRRELSSLV